MYQVSDSQKIGIGLIGFGVSFLFLGVLLLFDKGLLAIGNILFLSGLAFVIGLDRTFKFFFQRHKFKGTLSFLGGIFIVLLGWPLVGMIVEVYGFFNLFSGFFPTIIGVLRNIPVIGRIFDLPGVSKVSSWIGGRGTPEDQMSEP